MSLVSVLVVNYNGRRFLEDCLRSLKQQSLERPKFEIILIDNGSVDGSVEFVRSEFPDVRVIALPQNIGFAAANVAGLEHATGRYIALLNNDAVAEPGWLTASLDAMETSNDIGGVAAKIVFAHDPKTINSAGLVLLRDGRGADRGFRCEDGEEYRQPTDVFGACGAAVVYRREMLDDVGFFEPRFFMYYEDLDLAWRARRRGWRFVYAPDAVVRHVHCGSSGEWSPAFCFYVERNRVLTSIRNASMLLAVGSTIGLGLRVLRCWWRIAVTRGKQWRLAHGFAYLRAGWSLAMELPRAVQARFRLAK